MSKAINIQVVPWPDDVDPIDGAAVVQKQARDGQGAEEPCWRCGGSGIYGRGGESCRSCLGLGTARFVRVLRMMVPPDRYDEVAAWLDQMKASIGAAKIQTTVHLDEHGGGGSAVIVCGLKGEPLQGFGGRPACNGVHAEFYVHAAMVVSYSCNDGGIGSGTVSLVGVHPLGE